MLVRLFDREGFYPLFGSVQSGGGFAMGAGYGRTFARDQLHVDVNGAYTVKGYRAASAELGAPRLFGEHLSLIGRVRYRYFPQEDYYGIGADSLKDARSNYLLEETDIGAWAVFRANSWLRVSGKLAHLNPRIGDGTDDLYPTTQSLFTAGSAPGLERQPNFLESTVLVEADTRDQPGNPRSGTYLALAAARYRDRHDEGFDFSRVAGDLQQFIPIFDKKRVIALRAAFSHYDPAAGNEVPFYYMVPIGGKDTIRGFNDFRFRDLTAVLFNVEYRWEAFSGLDMALFYDLGDVGRRWDDIDFEDLKQSWGVGFRFNTYRSIFMRTEIAFNSGEGTRLFVAFSGPLRLERYFR
jgi:hypothetical protein